MKAKNKNKVHFFLAPLYVIGYMILIGLLANLVS